MKADGGIDLELVGNLGHQRFERVNVIGAQHTDHRGGADLVAPRAAQHASADAQGPLTGKPFPANRLGERFQDLIGNQATHFLEYDGRPINRRSTRPTNHSKNPQRWVPREFR